jgi:hypothetical protein
MKKRAMSNKRVLIIELTRWHGVTIIPQIELLKNAGYAVTLLMSDTHSDLPYFETCRDDIEIVVIQYNKRRWQTFSVLGRLWFQHYTFVVVNTMRPHTPLRALALYLFYLTYRGDVRYLEHNVAPETDSWLFRLLQRRSNRIYALSEKIYQNSVERVPAWFRAKLTYFYPGYFGDLVTDAERLSDRIIFAIPGMVNQKRRNYEALIDTFATLAQDVLRDKIEIHILGNHDTETGHKLTAAAEKYSLLSNVVFLQDIPFKQYNEYAHDLNRAHFILTLSDTSLEIGRKYNIYSTSATFMLSRAFHVPLVVSDSIDLDDDLTPFAVRYTATDVLAGIRDAVKLAEDREAYNRLQDAYRDYMIAMMAHCQPRYIQSEDRTQTHLPD